MTESAGTGDLTFGEAIAKLESIVARLEEDEQVGLEQAIALYEQGAALAGECQRRLDAAKLRITEIAVAAISDTPPAP